MNQAKKVYRTNGLVEVEPRHKWLEKYAPSVLNNAELLAILLHVGVVGENLIQLARGFTEWSR